MIVSVHDSAPYSIVEVTSDSHNLIFTARLMFLLFQMFASHLQKHLLLFRFLSCNRGESFQISIYSCHADEKMKRPKVPGVTRKHGEKNEEIPTKDEK